MSDFRVKNQLLMPQYIPQHTLNQMSGQLAQWGGDLDKLQFERVDAIPTQPVSSGEDTVRRRRKSVNLRCLRLKDHMDEAVVLLGAIQDLQDSERALRAARGLHYDDRGFLIHDGDGGSSQTPDTEIEIDDAYHESLRIPLLDQIDPDWADMIALQKRLAVCALGQRYTQVLEERSLPLCDAVSWWTTYK
jgi:hypothetical protein